MRTPTFWEQDAAFIAAASPDVVLGLLDDLEATNAALLQSQAREVGADARIAELEAKLADVNAAWMHDLDRATLFLNERDEAREAVRRLAGVLDTSRHGHYCYITVMDGDAEPDSCDCHKRALADPVVKKILEG